MRVLAHDMCSCRVFCVSYFVEFFVRENSCRIQRETRSGGLEVGTTHTKEKKQYFMKNMNEFWWKKGVSDQGTKKRPRES